MVLVALVLRLVVAGFLCPEHLKPDHDYWRFAGEVGHIAESLVEGHGYGNPFFGITGPTAWMPPVYPLLIAGVFRIFGIYTKASALVLLSLGSLFSALTCLPVFALARAGFGVRAALWAGWTWAFFPYAVYFSADFIWPTVLTTLLLSTLIAWLLKLRSEDRPGADFRFGLLAGVAALNDPIVLSVLPALVAWMYWQRRKNGLRWKMPAIAMSAAFVLIVTPWFARNYRTFHTFIPFRSTFGLELHIGNHGDARHFAPVHDHPSTNSADLKTYSEIGEVAFMAQKKKQALEFISAHPAWFIEVTMRRILYMWTSFWSFDSNYLADEPFDLPNMFLSIVMDFIALMGLYRAFRNRNVAAVPLALVLLLYPMVYYVTHWEDYYRRPIDPIFVVLAAYQVASFVSVRSRIPAAHEAPALDTAS